MPEISEITYNKNQHLLGLERYQFNQNQENSVGPKSYLIMMQVFF